MSTALWPALNKFPLTGLTSGQNRALLLDYDGTLAPFIADREHAYPYPEVPELLNEIARNCCTRVAIISGRSADEIPHLLGTSTPLEIWGCHGLERYGADGSYWRGPLDGVVEQALTAAAEELSSAGLLALTETKAGCVAVHWRGLTPNYAQEVKGAAYAALGKYVAMPGLRLQGFDEGVELRVCTCNKAGAVETILSELSPDAAVAYLGDDSTDEDAFRALNGRGLTILVRPTYRFTAAQFWLRPPRDLIAFLRSWIRICKEAE